MALLRSIALWGFLIICQNTNSVEGTDFCYRGNNCVSPDRSPGQCQPGKRQSPIDIPVTSSDFVNNAAKSNLFLRNCCFESCDFNAKNNGLNIEVEIQDGQKSPCTLNDKLVDNENYTLTELNFRCGLYGNPNGSEHSVNGKKYAMELHMVHYKSIYGDVYQAAASDDPKALTVLTFFFKICMVDNRALHPIIRALGSVNSSNSQTQGSGLVLANFLEINSRPKAPLMQYSGSTAIPNCTETAVCIVFKDPQCITLRQLNTFRNLYGDDGKPLGNNDRPLQERNNRAIQNMKTAITPTPQVNRRPGIFG